MKYIKQIIILIIFTVSNLQAQSGWISLNSGTALPLLSTYFINVNTGYIVGNPSVILKTTNAGINWSTQTIPSTEQLRSVFFTDVNTGYLAGGSLSSGNVYKTTNGGAEWNVLSLPVYTYFYSVFFINQNTGYVSGNELVLKTTDAGSSWTSRSFPGYSYISSIHFPDNNIGFACSYNRQILKTTNGGENWQNIFTYFGSVGWMNEIRFINSNTGMVVGGNTTDLGSSFILKTTNGGLNWNEYSFNNSNIYGLGRIQFVDASIGYIIGGGLTVNTLATIMKTTDGGESWNFQMPNTSNALRGVFFANINTGYAVGSGGTLLKTTDGGGNFMGISIMNNEIPTFFALYQNYPNPFNPSTRIRFALPKAGFTKLVIYDMLGKELETLVYEQLCAGTYEINWNADKFSSGVFFYRIKTEGFADVKRMILIK